ncbi:hypothetical protein N9Z36_08925 [Luminiphilus sp.]|nr:hypothetical protein [Luminiphilus sp.]
MKNLPTTFKRELVSSLSFSLFFAVLRFVSFVVTAKFLSVAAFGVYAFFAFIYMLQIFTYELAVFQYITKKQFSQTNRDVHIDDLRRSHTINLFSGIALVFGVTIGLDLLTVGALMICIFTLNITNYYYYAFVSRLRFHQRQSVEIQFDFYSFGATLLFITAPLVILNGSDIDLVIVLTCSNLLRTIFMAVSMNSRSGPVAVTLSGLGSFFAGYRYEAIRMFTNKLYLQAPAAAIGFSSGIQLLGQFNRSSYVVDQFVNLLSRAFRFLLLRQVVLDDAATGYSKQVCRLTLAALVASPFFYLFGILLAPLFIALLGEQYGVLEHVLPIFLMAAPFKLANMWAVQIIKGLSDRIGLTLLNTASILMYCVSISQTESMVTIGIILLLEAGFRQCALISMAARLEARQRKVDHQPSP